MSKDKEIIRSLAGRIAEIAALPVQNEKKALWRSLNGLKPGRPMVMIDQVCWNEMNVDEELSLKCEDKEIRAWEFELRKKLYQWKHFPVDSVMEGFFTVPKAIYGNDRGGPMNMGVHPIEHTIGTDGTNDVVSHKYTNQLNSMEDLEKIKMPVVYHDEAETNRRCELANDLFDGLLEVKPDGWDPYLSVWDPISQWMGVENALYALADEPEMMLALCKKIVAAYMSGLDQLTEQGLLCGPQSLIHCTGAWTDELPAELGDNWTTKQIWMFGLAQMFSTVSPHMFDEYEIEINLPIFERFGLVYYGCCDPLDKKMAEVKRIPNLRKISVSPWASDQASAEAIGKDFVFSSKPNPAYLVDFNEDFIRKNLRETISLCRKNNCPLELILKDISTVGYKPERLWKWAEIAMEEVSG